jgi:hypothetical protein
LSVLEQKLCIFHSKLREISEVNTVESHGSENALAP